MAYINSGGQLDNGLGLLERIQVAKVNLTAAQIQTMLTPIQIVPSPGAGFLLVPVSVSIQTKPGTVNFTGGGVVTVQYTGGAVIHATNVPAATILSGTGTTNLLPPLTTVLQPPVATGLTISNATAVFAAGNGTLQVKVRFIVQAIAD